MGINDHRAKKALAISTVPAGGPGNTTQGSITVTPGTSGTFAVTTYPDSNSLSLWNFLWSCFVDVDSGDHNYPNGILLPPALLPKLFIFAHYDWATSSDLTNIRTEYIMIINNDMVPHTVYLNYKAYTQPTTATAV